MKVLATGATGKFASLVVPALVRQGIAVRALVHDPAKADLPKRLGADSSVAGDLADPASLADALTGVDGVFLITPAFAPNATDMALNMIDAAQRAGVTRVVYNGVYHPSLSLINHAGTRPVEEALYHSDLEFTILQPTMYMQNLEASFTQARQTGTVVMPWSKHSQMTYVDYRDVANVVAIGFVDDRLSRGTFELAAPGMITRVELAELMSQTAGIPITAGDPDVDQWLDEPAGLAAMFADYHAHGFHGGNALVLRSILKHEPRSVLDFLTELAANPQTPKT